MGFVRIGLKTSVVGGLIYYTTQEGLWSTGEESVKFYTKLYNNVAPLVSENVPKEIKDEIPHLPSTSDISYLIKSNWNEGVLASMQFLVNLPAHTCNAVESLTPQVMKLFESSSETPKSETT